MVLIMALVRPLNVVLYELAGRAPMVASTCIPTHVTQGGDAFCAAERWGDALLMHLKREIVGVFPKLDWMLSGSISAAQFA